MPSGKKLTIKGGTEGTGSLTASPFNGGTYGSYGAGIGGGNSLPCGNIDIQGGVITANGGDGAAGIGGGSGAFSDATCGNITISGGTVTATSVNVAAGIGSGSYSSCGDITITNGVTKVTATKDDAAPYSIGAGFEGTCGTVTIGGTKYWENNAPVNGGDTYLAQAKIEYPEPAVDLSKLTEDTELQDGDVVKGMLAANVMVSIADGATVTLDGVTINGANDYHYNWAGITCLGDATIILKDGSVNTVKGFHQNYPGIHVPSGSTLTIKGGSEGTGTLTASPFDGGTSESKGAGIGGVYDLPCGNIDIQGGVITAKGGSQAAGIGGAGYEGGDATCGNITISGGTITATGGEYSAGIGGGYASYCLGITITNGVTKVTATKGWAATYSIGASADGSCGSVTIGGTLYWENIEAVGDGDTYLRTSPLEYQLSN